MKKIDEWYIQQDFDTVFIITGINLLDYPEADDAKDGNITRDDAIDLARKKWDSLTYEQKYNFYLNY